MADKTLVIFSRNFARWCKNHPNHAEMVKWPNVIANPNMAPTRKVKPEHWKLSHGRVLAMEDWEKVERDAHILTNGVDHNWVRREVATEETDSKAPLWLTLAAGAGAAALLGHFVLHLW
jgi:hypothetical protein